VKRGEMLISLGTKEDSNTGAGGIGWGIKDKSNFPSSYLGKDQFDVGFKRGEWRRRAKMFVVVGCGNF